MTAHQEVKAGRNSQHVSVARPHGEGHLLKDPQSHACDEEF